MITRAYRETQQIACTREASRRATQARGRRWAVFAGWRLPRSFCRSESRRMRQRGFLQPFVFGEPLFIGKQPNALGDAIDYAGYWLGFSPCADDDCRRDQIIAFVSCARRDINFGKDGWNRARSSPREQPARRTLPLTPRAQVLVGKCRQHLFSLCGRQRRLAVWSAQIGRGIGRRCGRCSRVLAKLRGL